MIKNITLLVALLFLMTSCTQKKVVIEGTIKNFNAERGVTVLLASSSENFNWNYFRDTVTVDSMGSFMIEIPTDDAVFVGLVFYGSHIIDFIAERDEKYSITVDLLARETTFNSHSKNQEGIDLMNTYTSGTRLGSFSLLDLYREKDATLEQTITKVENEGKKALVELKQLYDTKKISKSFYELAVIDREVFYNGLGAHFALFEAYDLLQNGQEVPEEVITYLEKTLADVDNLKYANSTWWYELANIAVLKGVFIRDRVEMDSMIGEMNAGKMSTVQINVAEKVFSEKKLLENYTANAINEVISGTSSKFNKEIIDNIVKFEKDFPNSKYSEHLRPHIDVIEEYHKKINDNYSKNIKFVQDSDNIDNFEELVALFKGKKLYVDIWATWCGPCKDEFQHNDELKKLLKEKGVEILYISIDGDENEQKWRDDIKYFALNGNHIRASKSLLGDIYKMYGGGISVPAYIIVGETGDMHLDAPRPSSIDELRKML